MSILTDSQRTCSVCGSLTCHRDEDCPTCSNCGRRGHLNCTRPKPVPDRECGAPGLPGDVDASYFLEKNPYMFPAPRPAGECKECGRPAHYHCSLPGMEGDWCMLHAPASFSVPEAMKRRHLEALRLKALLKLEEGLRALWTTPGHAPAAIGSECAACSDIQILSGEAHELVKEFDKTFGQ